ncbi:hypothetical protein [Herbiconiux sp. A18JL235]|uniref:DUF2188 domain-containing protein n=1 Tax=Herbiconiux sp. A18JL235 TaxID=3152363 RepID=A0AB39BML7_9MICO
MSSNVWVVLSVDGDQSEVVGIFESEQQANDAAEHTGKYVSVEQHHVIGPRDASGL